MLGSGNLILSVPRMSGPVGSKMWSTATLDDGLNLMDTEAELAALEAEENRLELELQDL